MRTLKLIALVLLGICAVYDVFRALLVTAALVFNLGSPGFSSFTLGYWVGTVLFAALLVWGFLKLLKNVRSTS